MTKLHNLHETGPEVDALQSFREDNLRRALLDYLGRIDMSCTVGELADAMEVGTEAVAAALHRLDDDGRVSMRNGWYRLSEEEKRRREGKT